MDLTQIATHCYLVRSIRPGTGWGFRFSLQIFKKLNGCNPLICF